MKPQFILGTALLLTATMSHAALGHLNTSIVAGSGFSSDSQQIAPQVCYNATEGQLSNAESHLSLQTAISFSDLEQQLNYSVSAKGGVGMFSADAEASYLRDVRDKSYSLSLNYYSYADATAPIQLNGSGTDALTATGQSIYKEGKNPYFGIICGDNYVSSYKKGALLAMALNVKFASHYQKEQFESKAGASFADIFTASGKIQQIATQYNIKGHVSLEAYQMGGEPSQLSTILSKDKSGNFYVLSCDLQHMDNCTKAASGLLNYASGNFTTQFSFKDNTGLTTLSTGFSKFEPIRYIGLTPPPSLVTTQVIQDRTALAAMLAETQYYQDNVTSLLEGYPVPWDEGSSLYKGITNLNTAVTNNYNTLMGSASEPDTGALGCYDQPDVCDKTFQTIESNYKTFALGDLSFLAPLQYIYTDTPLASYYFNGSSYGSVNNPNAEDQVQYMKPGFDFSDSNDIHYTIHTISSGPGGDDKQWDWAYTKGVLQPDGKSINILVQCLSSWPAPRPTTIIKGVSPYYFGVYIPPTKKNK